MSYFLQRIIILIGIWLISLAALAALADLRAFVDKTEIKVGERIRLVLEYIGQPKGEPDLSVLERDFDFEQPQKRAETSFINGNFSAKTSWVIDIYPKNLAKVIVIPAVKLGGSSSSPIRITQSESPTKRKSGVVFNVSTNKDSIYVNAEVILTIEIKTALSLRNATLTKPEIKDAIVEPLIEEGQSESIENGVKYHLFNRSYAIFPSKVGPLTISSVMFKAVTLDKESRRGWPNFFDRGEQIVERSRSFVVAVKDIPADFPKDQPFLPVRNLVVKDSFSEQDLNLSINKAATRRFEIIAQGTLASFLPTINPPVVKNMQIYAEAGNKIHKSLNTGIKASNQFSHVYMPTATAEILIPEQLIYWWDTDDDKLKTTSVKALQLNVTGTTSAAGEEELKTLGEKSPLPEQPLKPSEAQEEETFHWMFFVFILLLLSLIVITVITIKKRNRSKPLSSTEEMVKQIKEIISLCDKKDAKSVYQHLRKFFQWLEHHHEFNAMSNDLIALSDELSEALYKPGVDGDMDAIFSEIKQNLKKIGKPKKNLAALSPLYPN